MKLQKRWSGAYALVSRSVLGETLEPTRQVSDSAQTVEFVDNPVLQFEPAVLPG